MDKKNIIVGILILAVGLGVAFIAYQNSNSSQVNEIESVGIDYPTPIPTISQNTSEIINQSTNSAKLSKDVTPTIALDPKISPSDIAINIVGESGMPSYWRSELQQKIINPVIDYYKINDKDKIISLTISANSQANRNIYPYLAEIIFQSGAKAGFVIEKTDTTFKWWIPECLGACKFSEEFAKKYPEIVSF